MDSEGNLYIIGGKNDDLDSYDLSLIKFDNLGNFLWNRSWGQSGSGEFVSDIIIDSADNIYLTGWTSMTGVLGMEDTFLIKYISN
ncbi:MAG: hypothetical protein EU549_02600, partial [Promethearchaeota archaeon]